MSLDALHRAIEALYHVFSRYPIGLLRADPPWVTQEDVDRVQARTLRELSGDDLGNYGCSALTTIGGEDTFRHFLPRLLELVALEDGVGGCDTEIVIGKLRYAHWQEWGSTEKAAIQGYFHMLWRHFIEDEFIVEENFDHAWYTWDYVGQSVDSMLCTLAQAEDDLSLYLTEWLQSTSLYAIGRIAGLVTHYSAKRRLTEKNLKVQGVFWHDFPVQAKQLINWLTSGSIIQHLETAFFSCADTSFSSQIADAIDCLTLLQKQP